MMNKHEDLRSWSDEELRKGRRALYGLQADGARERLYAIHFEILRREDEERLAKAARYMPSGRPNAHPATKAKQPLKRDGDAAIGATMGALLVLAALVAGIYYIGFSMGESKTEEQMERVETLEKKLEELIEGGNLSTPEAGASESAPAT
jgi:predicted aconitase